MPTYMADSGYQPDIGRWLDSVLNDRGRGSAAEVARRGGLDEGWISNVRRGRKVEMTWESFTKLAHGLGMTRAHLLAAVDNQPPPQEFDRVEAAIQFSPQLLPEDRETLLGVYRRLRSARGR